MANRNPLTAGKAWRVFGTYLKRHGCRLTKPRRIICDHVFRHDGHFTAEQLARKLSDAGPRRVSRATVYQTLSLMVRAGLVREIRDAARQVHYERTLGLEDHEHLVCEGCGGFIEFQDPEIRHRIDAACRRVGFVPSAHRITVLGLCRECGARRARRG